jgi:hypothetical protein
MGHACNPRTQEAEAGESQVPDQPGLHNEALSEKQNKARCWWLIPVILATQEGEIRRIAV